MKKSELLSGLECQLTRHDTLLDISDLNDPEMADLVISYINDPDYLVRLEVYEYISNNDRLGKYKEEISSLLSDDEEDLRISAIEYLIKFRASDYLVQIKPLLFDEEVLVRAYAVLAVAFLGSMDDATEMCNWRASTSDSTREEASFYVFRILQFSDSDDLRSLLELLKKTTYSEKRFVASLLRDVAIEKPELKNLIVDDLLATYNSETHAAVKEDIGKRLDGLKSASE